LNVHRVNDVRQIEIHTAEPLVPDSSPIEAEIAVAKLKKDKSPGNDQILAELIQVGNEISWSEIHKLINSVWNKEELRGRYENFIPFTKLSFPAALKFKLTP
jgi:hypothetical protein